MIMIGLGPFKEISFENDVVLAFASISDDLQKQELISFFGKVQKARVYLSAEEVGKEFTVISCGGYNMNIVAEGDHLGIIALYPTTI